MERYRNLSGDSGVYAFETSSDYIVVEFIKGGTYLYTYGSAGRDKIEQMKILAQRGAGLGTFINKNARKLYKRKIR